MNITPYQISKPAFQVQEPLAPHSVTVTEYYRLGASGFFAPGMHQELIAGEIIDMSPIGPSHADWVDHFTRLFVKAVPDEITVRIQNPLRLDDYNEPEPDLALVHARSYREVHPGPADTVLAVEVADSSLRYDREVKIPLYARFGIPEVWLFDIRSGQLTVYRHPRADHYPRRYQPVGKPIV